MKKLILILSILSYFLSAKSQNITGVSKAYSFNIQKKIIPPILVVKEGSVKFSDNDHNGRLDAYESAKLSFVIQNIGEGPAYGLKSFVEISSNITGLEIEKNQLINTIYSGKSEYVSIPIRANQFLSTGKVNMVINVKEPNGLDCNPIEVSFNTLQFQEPKIEIVDGVFSTANGSDMFEKKNPAKLNLVIQNTGQSKTDGIFVEIASPNDVIPLNGNSFSIGSLSPGESYRIPFDFIATNNFSKESVNFSVVAKEGYGKYGSSRNFSVKIHQKLDASKLVVQSDQFKQTKIKRDYLSSDVDREIPKNDRKYSYRYALVIGNEDYTSKQTNLSQEVNVAFARNDANSFKNYLISTLGFEKEHVMVINDATSAEMNREIDLLVRLAKNDPKSEIVFYYAGHGLPDDNKFPYLLPVDVSTINLTTGGISLSKLNSKLANSNAKKITIFLDACFSGGGRDQGLLAARGVKINPKEQTSLGNMIVFASSSGEERSLPYDEKQHGFFTYFLLKKLKETKGSVNFFELSKYLEKEVVRSTLLKKKLQQTPHTNISPKVKDTWKTWSFR